MKKNIKEILDSIELSDEQVQALDGFFEEYTEKIKNDVTAAYEEQLEEKEEEIVALQESVEKHKLAFELFEEDAEKAFTLFEADAEKAFELFENDAEKAFELFEEESKQEYAVAMTEAIKEVYDDLYEKAQQDFLESNEYNAFNKVKSIVMPFIEATDQQLVSKIQELEAQLESVEGKKIELEKKSIIQSLVDGLPKKYSEKVSGILESCVNEDEIYQKYELILDVIESDFSDDGYNEEVETPSVRKFARKKSTQSIENYLEEDNDVEDDSEDVKPIIESKSTDNESKKPISGFSKKQVAMLEEAGLI